MISYNSRETKSNNYPPFSIEITLIFFLIILHIVVITLVVITKYFTEAVGGIESVEAEVRKKESRGVFRTLSIIQDQAFCKSS